MFTPEVSTENCVVLTARRDGVCAISGRPFKAGDTILWDRAFRKAYDKYSSTFKQFILNQK
jgi:hypothetical protein